MTKYTTKLKATIFYLKYMLTSGNHTDVHQSIKHWLSFK